MIRLTRTPINAAELLTIFESGATESGAVVSFIGKVRPEQKGGEVQKLHLQSYSPMTERAILQAAQEAQSRWCLEAVTIVHRVGDILPSETIVFVATAAIHRRAAFEAADFLMDYLKTEAVFWKKEKTGAGEHWIEPRPEDYTDSARWQIENAG